MKQDLDDGGDEIFDNVKLLCNEIRTCEIVMFDGEMVKPTCTLTRLSRT